jgi:hypothetical protein
MAARLSDNRDDDRPADLGADLGDVEVPDIQPPPEPAASGADEPPVEHAPGEQEAG